MRCGVNLNLLLVLLITLTSFWLTIVCWVVCWFVLCMPSRYHFWLTITLSSSPHRIIYFHTHSKRKNDKKIDKSHHYYISAAIYTIRVCVLNVDWLIDWWFKGSEYFFVFGWSNFNWNINLNKNRMKICHLGVRMGVSGRAER